MTNKKVYFITRSYFPEYKGGGAIVREQTVNLLRSKGYSVVIILFTTNVSLWENVEDVIPIKVNLNWIKYSLVLEHIGLITDYLSPWVGGVVGKLSKVINKDDIIFATSGGELGCIELATKIKAITGSKLLVNLHDPIDHTVVLGQKIPTRYHRDRTLISNRLLSESDGILTSSQLYSDELRRTLINQDIMIANWYFGFFGTMDEVASLPSCSQGFNLVYAGNMNNIQKPQVLIESLIGTSAFSKINFHFFGSGVNASVISDYSDKYENVIYHGQKKQSEIHEFYIKHAHAGFIPLIGDYFKPFVPSKLYDYIKFGLPVIAFLPDGDASTIINDSRFGVSVDDLSSLELSIDNLILDEANYLSLKSNLLDRRHEWSIENTSRVLFDMLGKLDGK